MQKAREHTQDIQILYNTLYHKVYNDTLCQAFGDALKNQ
jgi:hypothetical protein